MILTFLCSYRCNGRKSVLLFLVFNVCPQGMRHGSRAARNVYMYISFTNIQLENCDKLIIFNRTAFLSDFDSVCNDDGMDYSSCIEILSSQTRTKHM